MLAVTVGLISQILTNNNTSPLRLYPDFIFITTFLGFLCKRENSFQSVTVSDNNKHRVLQQNCTLFTQIAASITETKTKITKKKKINK